MTCISIQKGQAYKQKVTERQDIEADADADIPGMPDLLKL